MTTPSADQTSSTFAPRPPLHRSNTDKLLGGVCGGLAEYSGIDPLLWRVGAVALTLLGPGLIVYVLLWVLMPPAEPGSNDRTNIADQWVERLRGALSGPTSGHTSGRS